MEVFLGLINDSSTSGSLPLSHSLSLSLSLTVFFFFFFSFLNYKLALCLILGFSPSSFFLHIREMKMQKGVNQYLFGVVTDSNLSESGG